MNYEKLVNNLRRDIFDYDYDGKGEKADRVLRKAIARKVANYDEPLRDEFGATAEDHRQLGRQGIAWMD